MTSLALPQPISASNQESATTPILSIHKLHRSFGSKVAVNHLSFALEPGQICALLGPNGAGKTTLIKMLTGLLQPNHGQISYQGQAYQPNQQELKRLIGVVPQHNNIDRELTPIENLKVHGLLYGIRGKALTKAIEHSIEFSGLGEHRHQPAERLSGGMKRRLVIARALMHQPKMLFLDEATVGLDPHSRRHIWQFLRQINQQGCTIFLTTHYLDEAEQLADRVMLIERGKLIADASPSALKQQLGSYVVETQSPAYSQNFFPSRAHAVESIGQLQNAATIRETNLEDVFLNLTGRRLKPLD
ncbi:ABC transporter ATP-binding protein [Ferrimonas aestuarii]|uniref:ABC transporter ATP-binding protein n=1 Tax=Ferrimonas aestuarii TaxID=2569539 RepID=A0A4U1BFL0_9GAMM|nr:ABC transporter ATP-binding protein [Ferrimonas aestuarii]TKB50030.1 ABC transporter ATP-binding protein [Ferrimonas aestuarii]